MTTADNLTEQDAQQISDLSDAFDLVCAQRMAAGSTEYGPFAFLDNDTLKMALEELVDLSNYAKMTFIKLARLSPEVDNLLEVYMNQVGAESFIPNGG